MAPTIVMALIVAVPAVLILFFKSDAAVAFLSLCAGTLLVTYLGEPAQSAVASFNNNGDTNAITNLGLLLLPLGLSIFFLRHSVSAAKLPLNAISALATGVLALLLVVPVLPAGVRTDLIYSDTWEQISQYDDLLVGGSVILVLIVLWLSKFKLGGHGHKKKHH